MGRISFNFPKFIPLFFENGASLTYLRKLVIEVGRRGDLGSTLVKPVTAPELRRLDMLRIFTYLGAGRSGLAYAANL